MGQNEIFKTALSNFATDVACGGSIRHLTDIGYTLDQIVDSLDYPTPRAKVQKIMMEHLYESRVILREEPSEVLLKAWKIQRLQGHFRKETCYLPKYDENLTVVLHRKCEQNGELFSYISYRFENMQCLNKRQRDYLEGLRTEDAVIYHRIDQRMREIISKQYEAGGYHGTAYFLRTGEKLEIPGKEENGKGIKRGTL